MWGIEARNAAIAQTYFTAAINRVGTVRKDITEIKCQYLKSSYDIFIFFV